MEFTLEFSPLAESESPCLILPHWQDGPQSRVFEAADRASGGRLSSLAGQAGFNAKAGKVLMLYGIEGLRAGAVLLVGLGSAAEADLSTLRKAAAAAAHQLTERRVTDAVWTLHQVDVDGTDPYTRLRESLIALRHALYRFDQFKQEPDKDELPRLERLRPWLEADQDPDRANRALAQARAVAAGVDLARDLGNLPGNVCTPGYLAEQARVLALNFPELDVTILEQEGMEELGMGALLSVARGSRQPPKLIVMSYHGAGEGIKPITLVGKGLTFDAGGISLKPSEKMDEMKYDMCGGAAVFGVLRACLELKLPLNVVGVVPASENLPDGNANKPGDIVTSLAGKTIEVLNTDAEGRLILCDALTYARRFTPDTLIDIATLTGACIVALGRHPSGLFSRDDDLARELTRAGEASGDRTWRLPLWDDYQEQLKSRFADVANIGGRDAGAVTAACFLARFTEDLRWAHLDVAGTAWVSGERKDATGRPVPLLCHYLIDRAGAQP